MAEPRAKARQRVTIKEVAEAAGVSASTVSNALNGRSEAMTDETLQRIRQAIAALKYRRSGVARGLVTRRTATIGLLMAEIETPFFLQALHFIEPAARSSNYNLLLAVASNVEEERQALDFLLDKEADGLIFLSTSTHVDEIHLIDLATDQVPVVLINRASRHLCFDQINWDNGAGVASAVEHLIRLGHRRIVHLIGPGGRRSTPERLAGYRQTLERYGLPYDERYVLPGDFTRTRADWEATARQILALTPRPTAVMAADDCVAAACMRVFQQSGLRVPEDIAVVGVDDQPFASYFNPALTTVQLPVIESGKLAVEMLLDRMAGRRTEVAHVMLPCQLVVRESCGAHLGSRSLDRDYPNADATQ